MSSFKRNLAKRLDLVIEQKNELVAFVENVVAEQEREVRQVLLSDSASVPDCLPFSEALHTCEQNLMMLFSKAEELFGGYPHSNQGRASAGDGRAPASLPPANEAGARSQASLAAPVSLPPPSSQPDMAPPCHSRGLTDAGAPALEAVTRELPSSVSQLSLASSQRAEQESPQLSLPTELKGFPGGVAGWVQSTITTRQSVQREWPSLPPAAVLPDECVQVVVSEVDTPWRLYLEVCSSALNMLSSTIHAWVQGIRVFPAYKNPPQEGFCCLAPFQSVYYRAVITKVLDHVAVETCAMVFFVDYGNSDKVKLSELLPLTSSMVSLPPQAISCALAQVAPLPEKQGIWTEKEGLVLRQAVGDKPLWCQPVHRGDKQAGLLPLVQLHLDGGVQPSSLAEQLVQVRAAVRASVQQQVDLMLSYSQRLASLGQGPAAASLPKPRSGDKAGARKSTKHSGLQRARGDRPPSSCHQGARLGTMDTNSSQCAGSGTCSPATDIHREELCSPALSMDSQPRLSGQQVEGQAPFQEHSTCSSPNHFPERWTPEQIAAVNKETFSLGGCLDNRRETVGTVVRRQNPGDRRDQQSSNEVMVDEGEFPVPLYHGRMKNKGAERMEQGQRWSEDDSDDDLSENANGRHESSTGRAVSHRADANQNLEARSVENEKFVNKELIMKDLKCLVTCINSPSDFFVHFSLPENATALDAIVNTLNRKVGGLGKKKLSKLRSTFRCEVGALCCGEFQDEEFCRCRVLSIQESSEANQAGRGIMPDPLVEVYSLDYGDIHWVHKSKLYPLPEEVAAYAPLAVRCSLRSISPISPGASASPEWSPEAIEYFKKSVEILSKPYIASVKKGDFVFLSNCSFGRHQLSAIDIFLWEMKGNSEMLFNKELVQRGFAESCEVLIDPDNVNDSPMDYEGDEPEGMWDPMAEDHLSIRNSYRVDISDPGVATVGYKANDSRRICKYFNEGRCWSGDKCRLRHIPFPKDTVTYDVDEVLMITDDQTDLLPCEGTLVSVEVSCILTPQHFYVTLPYGRTPLTNFRSADTDEGETLEMLNGAINRHYRKSKISDGDLTVLSASQAVAVRCYGQAWHRAKVLDVKPEENKVQVFLVDVGSSEWVDERDTRQILPQFVLLPAQAVEVILEGIQPPQPGAGWTMAANKYFQSLVDKKTLVAHVLGRMGGGTLHVQLYDTEHPELDFNLGEKLVAEGWARPASPLLQPGAAPPPAPARPLSRPSSRSAGFSHCSLLPG